MFEEYISAVEKRLEKELKLSDCEYRTVTEAMNYSVSAGGKRIRPCLMLEFTKICGGKWEDSLGFAAALEMIHTYSLIHDDLPCMDNDDYRRGKPSCHKAYGEATALLAGDALLTKAFSTALTGVTVKPELAVRAAACLSDCSGTDGMIGGQVIDLKYENSAAPLSAVCDMYKLKTGALLVAAAKIGCILAAADEFLIDSAAVFAENIGLAFQIKDDILDITGNSSLLGKPVGSDKKSGKSTYVSLLGLEKAQNDVEVITGKAFDSLDCFGKKAGRLKEFATALCGRKY